MLNLKVHNPKRYKEYCTPTGNKEIDGLTEELYNSYSYNSTIEPYIVEILINYFTAPSVGYKILHKACFNILEKEGLSKWLIIRSCQNYVFEIDKIDNINFEDDSIGEQICDGDNSPYKTDWVSFLYTHNYPKEDIFTLLDIIDIKIYKTPKEDLGELGELD